MQDADVVCRTVKARLRSSASGSMYGGHGVDLDGVLPQPLPGCHCHTDSQERQVDGEACQCRQTFPRERCLTDWPCNRGGSGASRSASRRKRVMEMSGIGLLGQTSNGSRAVAVPSGHCQLVDRS